MTQLCRSGSVFLWSFWVVITIWFDPGPGAYVDEVMGQWTCLVLVNGAILYYWHTRHIYILGIYPLLASLKNPTLPVGSRPSFTWIILKTIFWFGLCACVVFLGVQWSVYHPLTDSKKNIKKHIELLVVATWIASRMLGQKLWKSFGVGRSSRDGGSLHKNPRRMLYGVGQLTEIGSKSFMWVFPKIVVPPNHPF